MKPANILTATALIIITSMLLGGCGIQLESNDANTPSTTEESVSEEVTKTIQLGQTVEKKTTLELEAEASGNEVNVRILLKNPEKQPIISTQTWLGYNPNQLKGINIDAVNSNFLLTAPYENKFNTETGIIQIGRSHPKPLTNESILVANLTFEVIDGSNPILIDAFNYQDDVTGNTSVNILVDETPYNVLLKPKSPLLVIN